MIVFLASFSIIMGVLYNYFSNVQEDRLRVETHMAARGINLDGEKYLRGLDTDQDYRVTWIASNGKVLFESSKVPAEKMENHLERKEVQQALKDGYGESRRYSSTLLERSLYAAQRLDDGSVIRLSVSQKSVPQLIYGMSQPIVLMIVIAVFLSLFLASRLSRRIVKPLNSLNLDDPLSNEEYDELSPLLHRIASQQRQLKWQQAGLDQKQSELNTIIDSMNDGMILLSQDLSVISLNSGAEKILHAGKDAIGRNLLEISRLVELQEAVQKAGLGERCTRRMENEMGIFEINAAPIRASETDSTITGIAIFLFDITQKENAEAMRREFTANVSHELKTPLTSISGYAELLENGMVKAEDIRPFAGKIHTEAQRMTHLIEDIINLSFLDEGAGNMNWEEVDLDELTRSVIRELQVTALKMKVEIHLDSEPAEVYGIRQQLKSIIFNLCENAIKYNKPGGRVDVRIQKAGYQTTLTVKDTGIGIPQEDLSRIFERFYRVDKSHSREIGGTGLGLSIVKHAVLIHKAKIEVQSEVGRGTEFTVTFHEREDSHSYSQGTENG